MDMRSIWHSFKEGTSHCSGCPGQEAHYPLGGIGSTEANLMLVGQEPAYNLDTDTVDSDMSWSEAHERLIEDRRESMNPLWKHMMNIAVAAGCEPEQLYVTNLAKCATEDSSFEDCHEHCSPYFARELGVVDPKVLLLHGSKVISSVFKLFGIEWNGTVGDVHAEIFEHAELTIVPLYHWGYSYRRNTVSEYNQEVAETVQETL